MIRIVLLNVLLLLLPTILYVGYVHLTSADAPKSLWRILEEAPLAILVLVGSGFAVATMLIFGTPPTGKPGEPYRPPVFKDGKIVPGQVGREESNESNVPER